MRFSKASWRLSALETRRTPVIWQPVPGSNVGHAARQGVGLPRRAVTLLLTTAATRSLALPADGLAVALAECLAKILRRLPALWSELPIAITLTATASATPAVTPSRTTLALADFIDADTEIVYPGLHPLRRQLLVAATSQ